MAKVNTAHIGRSGINGPDMEYYKNIGRRIREARESIGLSRPKLAEVLNMPPTTLKNYELCYRSAAPATLHRIAGLWGDTNNQMMMLAWLHGMIETRPAYKGNTLPGMV